ncbi:MAG TPA: glycogen debranching enzyme, partial [Desulfomonilaceae bacterium]|nr:glycogen debranching enzyme [Desulfomonilaceae bacterium]
SINFITCHDGFTLYDLVSYDRKHNEENGEHNQDGTDENLSWNCGTEGETDNSEIGILRRRQAKNFVAILLLSQGVPMLSAGDEILRSQHGNNNSYCQDNEMSWFNWTLTEKNNDMLRFVQGFIAFRKRHPCLTRNRFLTGRVPKRGRLPDVSWHGMRLDKPAWNDPDSQFLAFTLAALAEGEEDVHVVLNMSEKAARAEIPPVDGFCWYLAVDTFTASPSGVREPRDQPLVPEAKYLVSPRSVVVFESRPRTST